MKIVIIEDEIRIREGIINLIKKINESYCVIGEAEDGAEGLQLIKQTNPDLIITDIRMPDMDGLEMLRLLKEQKTNAKAIVLSAYSEFSYAQAAIKLGVSEYLVKPIAVGELTQSLKNIAIQLEQERRQNGDHIKQLQELENIFYSVLLGSTVVDIELQQYLWKTYGLNEDTEFIIMPLFLGEQYEKCFKRIKKELQVLLMEKRISKEYRLLEMPQSHLLLVILYAYRDEHALKRWFQNVVIPQIKTEKKIPMSFGWSSFQSVARMKNNLNTLLMNMDWNISLGNDVMISYPQVTQIQTKMVSYPIEIENRMKIALCAMNIKKINKVLEQFCLSFRDGNVYSPKELKESYVRFLWSMINVSKEISLLQQSSLEQQELLKRIMSALTYEELENTLQSFVSLLSDREGKEERNSLNIQRAKSLVHEFYNQGITLDEIAAKLNLTPEYLGTQFHKEMGINFSIYIKNFRINKSKELLIGTQLKLQDIAKKVGYSDPKYFSQVFRECTGQLPAEYRTMNH